jgi:HK97 family phage portal protein
MRTWLANRLASLAGWLARGKAMPQSLRGSQWSGTTYVDSYKRDRAPTGNELLQELKNTAWTCASINSAVMAENPPSLYVVTKHNQPRPKCATRPVSKKVEDRLRARPTLVGHTKAAQTVEEVTDHPLLELFNRPNPFLGSFDLWELTTIYQECLGSAFWYLDLDPVLNVPSMIWVLPAQNVTPRRNPDSPNLVDYYEYRTGKRQDILPAAQVLHFRYPDPRDPYTSGLSPLRAAFEQVSLTSSYAATRSAIYENQAVPSAIISPEEVIGEEERDRLEQQWNQRFRRGGSGKVVVAESNLRVQLLQQSWADLAALSEYAATKEDIVNAFHVPIAFVTGNTNLANLFASRLLHASTAIGPRLSRRDETINRFLIPWYDPTGRLFVDSGDATPMDPSVVIAQSERDLKYGVRSINEVRSDDGLPAVPWGEVPWVPGLWAPMDQPRQPTARGVGEPEKGEE